MTAILSALLFAASLSSTGVKEFFTAPAWLPASVDSANTPGSDPSSGTGGWYVAETTNGVNETHWTVTGDGLSISNQTIHYVNDELGFNVTQVAIRYAELKYPGYTEYWPVLTHVVGDRSTLCLSWDGAVYAFKDGTYHLLFSSLTATRESATQVPTGRFVPRAARLTPEVQSGVLSSFAGYFERQYYAGQGQTNDWDTAEWGPTLDKKNFWFSPDEGYIVTVETNDKFTVTTSVGYIGDAYNFYYRRVSQGWYCVGIGHQVADLLGVQWNGQDPNYIPGSLEDNIINGSVLLHYNYDGRSFDTNFTFTATRYHIVTTNHAYYLGSEFSYHPTNRVINSRRLVEYDNIKRLGEWIDNYVAQYKFVHLAPHRPEWIEGLARGEGAYEQNFSMWWSTTDTSVLDGTEIVPTMDKEYIDTNDWEKASQTFMCLEEDDVWMPYNTYARTHPTVKLMRSLDFGDQDFNAEDFAPKKLDKNYPDLLTNVYPHADAFAITNDTRRLVSDRLCAINQTLGLMDRTYHVPEVNYSDVATNYFYHNGIDFVGTPEITNVTYDADNYLVKLGVGSVLWDSGTRVTNSYSISKSGSNVSVYHEVSNTRTYLGSSLWSNGGVLDSFTMDDEILKDILERTGIRGWFWIDVYPLGGIYKYPDSDVLYISVIVRENSEQIYSQVDFTYGGTTNLVADFGYHRYYDYERSIINPSFGVTQPGFQGLSRASSKAGFVWGEHYQYGQTYTNKYTLYSSGTYNYPTRDSLVNRLGVISGSNMFDDFKSFYGLDPYRWDLVIPLDMMDVYSVRDSVKFNNVELSFGRLNGGLTSVSGTYDGSEISISYKVTYYNDYQIEDYGCIGVSSVSYDVERKNPSQVERVRKRMDGKIGAITRTDWDWHTLKRSTE